MSLGELGDTVNTGFLFFSISVNSTMLANVSLKG